MIEVEEAKELIRSHCHPLPPVVQSLDKALQLVLAEDVYSPINMPSFNQSAMDGYAFRFDDFAGNQSLNVISEIQAGSQLQTVYQPGSAVRIFTGAPVPEGYDTVVMQEHTSRSEDKLFIASPSLLQGGNVRLKGCEITKKTLALPKETLLTAGAIGFLSSLGIVSVPVYPKPAINIIVTGKELTKPGTPLIDGQVYESNSVTLKAALQQSHFHVGAIHHADDNLEQITELINESLEYADMVLITGGVSVGDYDFVTQALEVSGAEIIFHKIKQKPGKPLLFAKKKQKVVFGLPGNPSSVLTCFYEYVTLALEQITMRSVPFIKTTAAPLSKEFTKPAGLTHFLKGSLSNSEVTPLTGQESFRLSSFAVADCLIQIEADKTIVKKGEQVEVHILPS